MSGEGTTGTAWYPSCRAVLWELMEGCRGSRTAVSCTLSWTSPSSGDESVTSAEGWPHGCWLFLRRDADVSGECWAQAGSPGCAVTDKLWHGQCLILEGTVK